MGTGKGSSRLSAGSYGGTSEKALSKQSENWYYNKLTDAEKSAVINAQNSTFQLNEFLSGRRTDFDDVTRQRLQTEAENLDSALSKFKTTGDVVTYRGVNLTEFTNTYLGIDTTTNGVKSTSYDINTAKAFARNQGGFVIEYHIKAGNHGADVNGVAGANEREFLIRNNMRQKVVAKQGNKLIVEIG